MRGNPGRDRARPGKRQYILGEEVEAFEHAFADYCGGAQAVGVASGTDALILALKALGIGPGDEVITVSHTAVATVAAILATGATPVLIDVDETYMMLDATAIDAAITPRTRALIAVHLYGQAADLDAILGIARRHGLAVIEDCAQAVGGRYRGRRLGSIGDIGCFSFYPTKNLGAIGDGGLVLTADAKIAARVRRLRQYGWDDTRETHEAGLNSASIRCRRRSCASSCRISTPTMRGVLRSRAATRGSCRLATGCRQARLGVDHAYHLYVVASEQRDRLRTHLSDRQIGSAVHYPVPVHRQRGYAERAILPAAACR